MSSKVELGVQTYKFVYNSKNSNFRTHNVEIKHRISSFNVEF